MDPDAGWTSPSRHEWTRLGGMAGFIVALHVAGWGVLLLVIAPQQMSLGGTGVYGVGIGVTAYVLGMRHAFDADHIAAIDNTTRKLMSEGQRPLSVGFWFSLGHSSVVFGLAVLFAVGMRSLAGQVQDNDSTLQQTTGLIGTLVSGSFLYLIAAFNLAVMLGILRAARDLRRGTYDAAELERRLNSRGLLNRVLGRVTRAIGKPWHMYPLGLLFGLGFDTATEVALLFLAGGAAGAGLPWYAIICLPVLFAAGMSLFDTVDGTFMNFAYGWAFSKPVRKIYYNLVITGLSIAVAFLIGTTELLGIAADQFGLHGGLWSWVTGLDLNLLGYATAGLFVLAWAVSLVVWRVARIEERWSAPQAQQQDIAAVTAD